MTSTPRTRRCDEEPRCAVLDLEARTLALHELVDGQLTRGEELAVPLAAR